MIDSLLPKQNLEDLKELLRDTPTGATVEVGVYKGGSALALHTADPQRPLHLFDTFAGIPEKTDDLDIIDLGKFSDVDLSEVKKLLPTAIFHVGVFPETLPDDLVNISFVHIDCDQYQTCKKAIDLLWPRMNIGGVIAFDDFPFEGIRRAIRENLLQIEFTNNHVAFARKN